jgi:hypothetical protein
MDLASLTNMIPAPAFPHFVFYAQGYEITKIQNFEEECKHLICYAVYTIVTNKLAYQYYSSPQISRQTTYV